MLLQNTIVLGIDSRFYNTPFNTAISMAVSLVNRQSRYRSVYSSYNRLRYDVLVNAT